MAEAMQWLRFYEHFWSGRLDALEAALAAHAPRPDSPESQHE